MADSDNNASRNTSAREAQEAMEKQIASLKREIGKINKTLADRAEEVVDEAAGWYDTASDKAARTAQQLRTQAQTVSETVRENPGTVSTAMIVGGVIGLILGMAIGQSNGRDHRWF